MTIRTVNIIRSSDGSKMLHALEQSDRETFDRLAPYGLQVFAVRCLEVDGKLYPLADGTPADGLEPWSAAGEEAAQVALDAAIAAMPKAVAERMFPGHEPWAVRKAKRIADDAEADARAAQAAADKADDEAKAAAAAERRAIAEADAVAKSEADEKTKEDATLAAMTATDTKTAALAKAAQAAADADAKASEAQAKRAAADAAKAAHEARP